MKTSKSTISKAKSYVEIGKYWDKHSLSDVWDQTKPVKFEFDLKQEAFYYAVEPGLSERIQHVAMKQGLPASALVNLWLQEKLGTYKHA